jgi:hypothetical protein
VSVAIWKNILEKIDNGKLLSRGEKERIGERRSGSDMSRQKGTNALGKKKNVYIDLNEDLGKLDLYANRKKKIRCKSVLLFTRQITPPPTEI